ncbi:MAG: RNA polymerase sigma factor [Amphiplicatus sp.]
MSNILDAFLKNKAAIRRRLGRFCASADDIDDILHEAFLRGFAAETKATISEPKAYLFQIARNIALDRLRKNALAPIESLEDSGGSSLILDEEQVSADEWLEGRQKLMLFTEAVAHLPPQCRKAFLMRHIEGCSYRQIANRMDISVSAVEKHVTSGLVKCDAYLRSHGYKPSDFGAASRGRPASAKARAQKEGCNSKTGKSDE